MPVTINVEVVYVENELEGKLTAFKNIK
jgi:hypothetical protein